MLKFSRRSNICSVITVLLSPKSGGQVRPVLCERSDPVNSNRPASLGNLNFAVQKSIIDVSDTGDLYF